MREPLASHQGIGLSRTGKDQHGTRPPVLDSVPYQTRGVQLGWVDRLPLTEEAAGSSPVAPAISIRIEDQTSPFQGANAG